MKLQELYDVPVPRKTASYSPVPHKELIEHVQEELYRRDLTVINANIQTARDGLQMIGHADIQADGNDELGMRLAFRNSYDKSMSVAFVAGANVWICSNGMISGDIQFMRKHTGTVLKELKEKIQSASSDLEKVFEMSTIYADDMKRIKVDKGLCAELCGKMFIEHDIITSTQLGIIKKEITNPSFDAFKEDTAWSLYNHTTFALKKAHPSKYINQHLDVHNFFEDQFKLV